MLHTGLSLDAWGLSPLLEQDPDGLLGEERAVRARAELFREGDPGDALYCILEGRVSLRVKDEKGHALEIGVRQAGDAVGQLAGPRSATVTTAEACRVFVIEPRAFLKR